MARPNLADQLQVFSFWLFDASIVQGLGVPVFSPLSGFTRISMPELSLTQEEIQEVNWIFPSKVIKSGSLSNITLERGSTFWNSDFWIWTIAAAWGDVAARRWLSFFREPTPQFGGATVRRNLVLVQFFPRNFSIPGVDQLVAGVTPTGDGIIGFHSVGPFENTSRLPNVVLSPRIPAKAWLMAGCLPTRCKPGSDFDANSSDVSIQELEISIEDVEEISLADNLLR